MEKAQEKKTESLDSTFEDAQDNRSFMEMYEESLQTIQEGKVVRGEIVQIDEEFVLVDIGYKSEGQIRINEFLNSDGQLAAKVGQKVDVLLVRKEDKEGRIILSREKAATFKIWDDVAKKGPQCAKAVQMLKDFNKQMGR